MQRYFVAPGQFGEAGVTLAGEDARHLSAVMRAKPGDVFIACDGAGREAKVRIDTIGTGAVAGTLLEWIDSGSEMAWRVAVAQSLPKGDKLETVIQKGTEAGAARFQPFVSRRTIVQYDERKEGKRLARWRTIAKEAAEQSHRSIVPEVKPVISWKELLASFREFDSVLLCYEEEGRSGAGLQPALAALKNRFAADGRNDPSVLLVVGPEGGFDPREAEEAEANGATAVGLGRRILRTETAALVALACIAYESGEMGG
ncbi:MULTISPECIES: RsmE family RNA methyltransferase [Cohnella]|uniref:RsmE family RNA methyltransferase n=1 Tax=Cohnella TaxID=329857 RepID=UPI0009BA2AFC|nr:MULTISPECIES: RsmE family RNA methyltransferase [Cohnella]MBN2983293.1 16S rRNA (uracil(1498)-N(3))-methyltransferase [Cohnella algarum]